MMEEQSKFLQQTGNQMYKDLVDFTAAFLFSLGESDNPKDLLFWQQWFLKYIVVNDGSIHDGDCTQQPYSCPQCLIDSYREKAEIVINKQAFEQYLIDEELCVI